MTPPLHTPDRKGKVARPRESTTIDECNDLPENWSEIAAQAHNVKEHWIESQNNLSRIFEMCYHLPNIDKVESDLSGHWIDTLEKVCNEDSENVIIYPSSPIKRRK